MLVNKPFSRFLHTHQIDCPRRTKQCQEKEYLKPAVSSITSTQILLQKSIENLATKNHFLGIPTTRHLEALRKYGPCEIHRKSFEPIKSMVMQK